MQNYLIASLSPLERLWAPKNFVIALSMPGNCEILVDSSDPGRSSDNIYNKKIALDHVNVGVQYMYSTCISRLY